VRPYNASSGMKLIFFGWFETHGFFGGFLPPLHSKKFFFVG
jgi:hypothetical protein